MQQNVIPQTKWTPTQRWMLVLMIATGTFVAAIQMSCLPPLFKEIADDLGLDVVQVGSIWGLSSLAGIFVSIIGGVLSDRFGTRRIVTVLCILTGITGALRGVADSYFILALMVIFNGSVRLMVPVCVTKELGLWFKGSRLGLAMGAGAMGMGLGLMLGTQLSAAVLSPWLGSWRYVMYFLGALSVIIGLLWWLLAREAPGGSSASGTSAVSIKAGISELVRVRAVWMVGLILMFRVGCMMATTGYVPYYLRDHLGWADSIADAPLTAFYAVSAIFVVPLAHFSDRVNSRKIVLVPAAIITIFSIGLMPLLDGDGIWTAMIVSGMFMDGFMSLAMTMLMEAGIKPAYSGIALGGVMGMAQLGAVGSPPLGNWLGAVFSPGTPYFFWASLSAVSLVLLLAYHRKRPRIEESRTFADT